MIIIQIIISIVLVALILLQQQSGGVGSAWGGLGGSYHTKQGAEKIVFWATIGCIVLFVALALANILFR